LPLAKAEPVVAKPAPAGTLATPQAVAKS